MSPWPWVAVALLPALPVLALLTALLERSGPIRMRHWVEEAGGGLRVLYEEPVRFEVFRYLLNLLAKLVPLALFGSFARVLAAAGPRHPFLLAGGTVALLVAIAELASRSLLGRDPEEALRRMTFLYRLALTAMMPAVLLISPLVPRRGGAESVEGPDEEATEEEVEAFIDVGTREGILEPGDRDLVWGVVDFGDTQVRSVMTPRVDIVAAPVDAPIEDLVKLVVEHSISRLPLYRESIDQIVGIVHIRDLVAGMMRTPHPPVSALAKPPFLVPETKPLDDLLREFQARRQQIAIAINEWGATEGLVTIEDLVEEIVGEIQDEYDESEPENRLLADGSLLLDGRASLDTLHDFFEWHAEDESSETVGGLVSGVAGCIPGVGEIVELDGLRFQIESSDERRILSLRVRRMEEGSNDAP